MLFKYARTSMPENIKKTAPSILTKKRKKFPYLEKFSYGRYNCN